jgi:small subunit ribosomal protein S18
LETKTMTDLNPSDPEIPSEVPAGEASAEAVADPTAAAAAPSEAVRGPREPRRPGQRRFQRRKVCPFLANKITYIDYKDAKLLRRFVTERGKILPRRITGVSAKYQRMLTTAIKRARIIALLPFRAD